MKRVFEVIKTVLDWLLQPAGSLSKELALHDPIDKPVLCYEHLLYLVALGGTALVKIIMAVDASASYLPLLRIIALVVVILVIFVALFHLLVPPRLSLSRLAFVVINTLWLLVLLSPR